MFTVGVNGSHTIAWNDCLVARPNSVVASYSTSAFEPSAPTTQDPTIHSRASRIYLDGRAPASWDDLSREIQLKILAYIVQISSRLSKATHTTFSAAEILSLLLVNKRTSDQVRHFYQQNRFFLVHGLDYMHGIRDQCGPHHGSMILKYPRSLFCAWIKRLEIRFCPQSTFCKDLLDGTYSWAPLLRYREGIRLARASNMFTATVEAENARRIAWQTSLISLRHFKIIFDFARTDKQMQDLRMDWSPDQGKNYCYDPERKSFVRLLGLMETAFPGLEGVDVEVTNLFCFGHSGMWSRISGLEKGDSELALPPWNPPETHCAGGCPQRIGQALESALLRCSGWKEL